MLVLRDYLTDDIIDKLYTYSKRKVRQQSGSFAMTGEDVVHDAIEKTLSGVRPWNQEKCPHLLVHLLGCCKSIVSNHAEKKETKTVKRESDFSHGKKNETSFTVDTFRMDINYLNLEILSPHENSEYAFNKFKELMNYLSENREDLIDLAEQILIEGRTKPKELALYFSITVKEVNVKKTALKRILIKLQEGEK